MHFSLTNTYAQSTANIETAVVKEIDSGAIMNEVDFHWVVVGYTLK